MAIHLFDGYGNPNDTLLALNTTGNSLNVINAITVAKAKEMKTIGLTGENGGKMKTLCDIIINVPETRTAYVQELHLPIDHTRFFFFCTCIIDFML